MLTGGNWVSAASQADPRPGRSEKESRTAAQRKIDSQLLREIYRLRGDAAHRNIPDGRTGVRIDEKQRALVDVRADVTPELQGKVAALGGTIVSSSREHRSIVAWIPLLKLEALAEDRRVRAIGPLAEAMPHQ